MAIVEDIERLEVILTTQCIALLRGTRRSREGAARALGLGHVWWQSAAAVDMYPHLTHTEGVLSASDLSGESASLRQSVHRGQRALAAASVPTQRSE